jgi:hypothetical protein
MPPEHDQFSKPEAAPSLILSAEQIVEANAKYLTGDLTNAQKGSASASVEALQEVHEMQRGGYLNLMTKDLEKNGAKVVCGPGGEIDHIIFPGTGAKPPVDIDVHHDTINGQSTDQAKAAAATQVKEFVTASLADANVTDASGKPLSPEAQAQANKLVSAMMDGDVDAVTRMGKEIMKNPETARSIEQVLDRIEPSSGIRFNGLDEANPYMTLKNGGASCVVVPEFGPARANRVDYKGEPTGEVSDLKETMKDFQGQALWSYSHHIDSAQIYLQMFNRLPADGFTNMKSLESAYGERHHSVDNEKLHADFDKAFDSLNPR